MIKDDGGETVNWRPNGQGELATGYRLRNNRFKLKALGKGSIISEGPVEYIERKTERSQHA